MNKNVTIYKSTEQRMEDLKQYDYKGYIPFCLSLSLLSLYEKKRILIRFFAGVISSVEIGSSSPFFQVHHIKNKTKSKEREL